ncbi:hypothetical protein [Gloeobacter morelensis]|uniref:Uncharacterized protein n=1 Tax=Gloeobacter morelensis MG652769 TaxID=2781736 RepID=A0ABY3PG63_9CYAN|nr:hypothetical protein [Gloeobacter morelensis]UFP92630.1 hypothetical protein ISF26_12330 [Gloeobacter morelensis MG652769]
MLLPRNWAYLYRMEDSRAQRGIRIIIIMCVLLLCALVLKLGTVPAKDVFYLLGLRSSFDENRRGTCLDTALQVISGLLGQALFE